MEKRYEIEFFRIERLDIEDSLFLAVDFNSFVVNIFQEIGFRLWQQRDRFEFRNDSSSFRR
ncbi:hypothetical protein DLM78_14675 [Leptospira stimsonii]|uniref:Uncharacterized protein n=1 Tax=Leptospira stimsonii TaxID=2202203 RepID=A0A8B3CRF1_9LEPT|nr:hypothetical protein DLM78_14675 [Leptospira stimsonii]